MANSDYRKACGAVNVHSSRFVEVLACLACCIPWLGSHSRANDLPEEVQRRMASDLQYLSSDDLAGRDVGSPGIELAAKHIAERFEQLGLRTDSFDGGPLQQFSIPGPPKLGPSERNRLTFSGLSEPLELVLGEDFIPVSLGNNGSFSGQIAFVGYGISAPELSYDDYANLDVTGKVVIVLRKEPNQNDPQSKFDGDRSSQHAFFSTKELNAALHRAAAMILVNDRATVAAAGGDTLPDVAGAGSALSEQQIPTIFCQRIVVDRLLQSAGLSLDDLELAIDAQTLPQSRILAGISVTGETQIVPSKTTVHNVVGLLPGRGALAAEYVIIGAHYDHVGMGGMGSLAPGTIEVHNGADDNASGTTALLEVARRLVEDSSEARRSIIFIAFTAEERGLLGSKYYVRYPRWPLEQTVAMLNMDMVGRLTDNNLTVYGTGTATQFNSLIDRANELCQLEIDKQAAGFGPSDHSSFYEVDIPVFHFFTGLHNDYHRPSDDFEKANVPGMARIADFVTAVLMDVATLPERPTLIKSSVVAQIGRALQPRRVTLGVRLENSQGNVLKVKEVLSDSPAQRSGIQTGDIIVALGEQKIESLAELQRMLANSQAGTTVMVEILRGGEGLRLSVTF